MLSALAVVLVIASLLGINWISNWFRSERNRARIEANPENYKLNNHVGHDHWTDVRVGYNTYDYVGDKPSDACRKIMEHEEQR